MNLKEDCAYLRIAFERIPASRNRKESLHRIPSCLAHNMKGDSCPKNCPYYESYADLEPTSDGSNSYFSKASE